MFSAFKDECDWHARGAMTDFVGGGGGGGGAGGDRDNEDKAKQ